MMRPCVRWHPISCNLFNSVHSFLSRCSAGINIFLDGYVPTENLRFRETSLVFKVAETANEEEVKRLRHYQVWFSVYNSSVSDC